MNLIIILFLLALSEGIATGRRDLANGESAPNEVIVSSNIPIKALNTPPINNLEGSSNTGPGISSEVSSNQLDSTVTSQDIPEGFLREPTIDAVFCKMSKHPFLVSCRSEVYANALINANPDNESLMEPTVESVRENCALADDIGFDLTMFGLCCPLQQPGKFGFPCVPVVL